MPLHFGKRRHPMNLTLAGIEELDQFPSAEEREKALADHAKAIRGWDLVLGIVICGLVLVVAMVVVRVLVRGVLPRLWPGPVPNLVSELLSFGAMIVCVFLTLRWLHRIGAKQAMRKRLLEVGVPVCMKCGYMLRGLPATTEFCPECGAAVPDEAQALIASIDRPAKSADSGASTTD